VLRQPEGHDDGAILEDAEQRILGLRIAGQQIARFRQHRLADQKWGIKFCDPLGGPSVMTF
jgi:regulator of PEP synthase PpsR (kinase-PPPase family)